MRYRAIAEYNGKNYYGWQTQPGKPTVQGEIEEAIKKLCGYRGDIKYASRTDRGVHSKGQVLSFSLKDLIPPSRVEKALNPLLPEDICLKNIKPCRTGFNPRYDNKGKLYVYRILNSKYNDYMLRDFVWHIPTPINWQMIEEGISMIKGTHDFLLFSSPRSGKKKTSIKIENLKLKRKGKIHSFYFKADYFLMYMVRYLSGFLVALGRGKEGLENLKEKLEGKGDRCTRLAPAKGLELRKVF